MKQLLFLLLFPCLALAQYQGNANQKITLGEQTTADGLVWRGSISDTANLLTNKLDTSVYIVLDTATRAMWYYRVSTTPKWTRLVDSLNNLQGQLSLTTKVTGVLPVANGGTGADMSSLPNNYLIRKNSSGVFDTAAIFEADGNVGIGTTAPLNKFYVSGTGNSAKALVVLTDADRFPLDVISNEGGVNPHYIRFYRNSVSPLANDFIGSLSFEGNDAALARRTYAYFGSKIADITANSIDGTFFINTTVNNIETEVLTISAGNFGFGTTPTEKLHVVGNARISGLANAANPVNVQVDVNGVLVRTSSIDIKEDVQNLPYGLNEIMLLQPSKFSYIDKYKYGEGYDIGFIAQDVNNVIPEAVGTGIESDIFMDSVKLIPVLTKAIQEQQALIKALEQRIINLENK